MTDSWCEPIRARSGRRVSGGAARNVRIAGGGGMDVILQRVARKAAEDVLEEINYNLKKKNARPNLRLVKKAA